jgi:hypothetical protein
MPISTEIDAPMAKNKDDELVTISRSYLLLLWRQLDELRERVANSPLIESK